MADRAGGAVALEVEIELAVGEDIGGLVSRMDGERGLADATHPRDRHRANRRMRCTTRIDQRADDVLQLGAAPGEVRDGLGQLTGAGTSLAGGRGGSVAPWSGRGPRCSQQATHRFGVEVECRAKRPDRLGPGTTPGAALEHADALFAEAGLLRQEGLGESGRCAKAPQ